MFLPTNNTKKTYNGCVADYCWLGTASSSRQGWLDGYEWIIYLLIFRLGKDELTLNKVEEKPSKCGINGYNI